MAGTLTGGLTAAQTNKERYGDDWYKRIGAMGGKKKVPKGFAVSGLAREAGRKGGTISRKTSKK